MFQKKFPYPRPFAFMVAAFSLFAIHVSLAQSAFSSSEGSASEAPPLPQAPSAMLSRSHVETSVSLGALGQFTPTRGDLQGTGTLQTLSSAGALTSFRQSFNPWLGYTVNFSYTRTIEEYRTQVGATALLPELDVKSNIYELTTGYMVHRNFTPKLQAFADVGGGVLIFAPLSNSPLVPSESHTAPTTIVRATGLINVGADYALSDHFALRAEYRGLIYKGPEFGIASPLVPFYYTLTSEPSMSLVYNFNGKKK